MAMDQRQFFLRDLLTVLFKHLWLIILLPILVLLIVFVGNYVWPATYESQAQIRLLRGAETQQADAPVTRAAQAVQMVQMSTEDINSEIALLTSREVLMQVVELEGLANGNFPYYTGVANAPFEIAKATANQILYVLQIRERPRPEQAAMRELERRLIAEPVRDSHVMLVRLRLGDPDHAQRILNTVLEVYQREHVRIYRSPDSAPFFQEQRQRISERLHVAQNELQQFRSDYNITLLEPETELRLEEYARAQTILTELEMTETAVTMEDIDAALISSLSSQTESIVVREMQLRLLELLTELNRVATTLGPAHPTVQSLREQVRNMQRNLIEAIANVKQLTENRLHEVETRMRELTERMAQHEELEREVNLLVADYEYYATRFEEAVVRDELAERQVSAVRVMSTPTRPLDPVRPNKLLNLMLALIGGIIAALALAFFLDYLDHGLKTPEDVEYYVKVPPLASFFNAPGQALDPRQAERLAVLLDSVSPKGVTQVLMVTSSVGGEGSNQVASALANAHSSDPSSRTLLVDLSGDLSRAKNARYGVTDVLLEQADFDEVFEQEDSLTIIGRGSHSDYPAHLWAGERMTQLIADLRARYQHIIVHVGAILQSQDAMLMSRQMDGILLVVKADSTRREVVNRALDSIKDARPKVLGAVLTERTQTIPQSVYRRI